MEYSTRRSLLEKERTYVLGDDAIEVREAGKPAIEIPFRDIVEVNLAYLPNRYHSRIHRCLLRTRSHGKIPILNTHMAGFARFEDRSASFTPFVRELHRRLVPLGAQIRFTSGVGAAMWGCTILMLLLVVAAGIFVGLLLSRGAELTGSAVVKLGLLAVLLPAAIAYIRVNRPKRYDPANPPDRLLPS